MWPLVILVSFLLALANARVLQLSSDPYNFTDVAVAAGDEPRPFFLPYPFASDDFYDRCKCKGQNFWRAMHSSSADAGKLFTPVRGSSESVYTDPSALATWAWKDAAVPAINYKFDKAWGIDHVLRAIGASDKATKDGGSIQVFRVAHGDADADAGSFGPTPYDNQPQYTSGGQSFRVTGSEYTFGFDTSGVLLAMNRKSPQYAGGQRKPKVEGDGLPDLHSFSDIAWLKWKAATGSVPSSLRYFASIAITNQETRGVFAKVLDKAHYKGVPAWPGYDVDANTDEGAALMGTPNALAFSYILVQHKSSLGNLKISKITLFKNSLRFADACMVFHVDRVAVEDMEGVARARL
ncbi:hypothetical protein N0V95_004524 [Ascochyta clinopodiicola]|nr:hypothetical protein N0V95_004524 [Ascochyta clinopodiicola]